MTGSYFRGDAIPVLSPEDEARFDTVVYTYYEQLNGYQYLESPRLIGYWLSTGSYLDTIGEVLDPDLKMIVQHPQREFKLLALTDKHEEALNGIFEALGEGVSIATERLTSISIRRKGSDRILRVADLVDDTDGNRRSRILAALRDPAQYNNRDHVDIIIALGMAKEGFDWICASMRSPSAIATASPKSCRLSVASPAMPPAKAAPASPISSPSLWLQQSDVVEAVNDTLKAIAASLLMEQVLAPKFDFTPRNAGPQDGFEYDGGYQEGRTNVGVDETNGRIHVEIGGLKWMGPEAARICREDLNDVIAAVVQDKETISKRPLRPRKHDPAGNYPGPRREDCPREIPRPERRRR